jgi:iron complex outermembrane receptor protein
MGEGYYEEFREDQEYSDYGLTEPVINSVPVETTDMVRRKWMENDFYGAVWSVRYRKNRLESVIGGGLNSYNGDHFGKIIWMQYAGSTPVGYEWYNNNGMKNEINLFGKGSYMLSDKLSGFIDLQYRQIGYTMRGLDDDLRDLGQKHDFRFFNPKAGLFYTISSGQDVWASFAVAQREPTRADFKEATGDTESTPESETLYDTEMGYSLRTGIVKAGINIYAMLYDNQLIPTGEISDVGYPIMTNVKRSYRAGIELSLELKPVKSFEASLNLTLSRNRIEDFTAWYTDYNTSDWSSEYKSMQLGAVDLAYSPSLITSGEFTWTPLEQLSFSLVPKYVGKQYFDNTMNINRMLDPYFVNNIRIGYFPVIRRIKGLDLWLHINNIFNSIYESNGYGGLWYEDGVEQTWAYYFPQAGINFLVKAGIRF